MTTPAPTEKARKQQVRPRVLKAIEHMVETGASISAAAEMAGMRYESLRVALRRPHVREAMAGVRRAWLESETLVAWNTVASLQRDAASEDVRLKSARTVLGAVGELEPEGARRSEGPPLAIQIIVNERWPAPPVADSRGVIEAPAYSPVQHGAD